MVWGVVMALCLVVVKACGRRHVQNCQPGGFIFLIG
jgi:hypothetical protein